MQYYCYGEEHLSQGLLISIAQLHVCLQTLHVFSSARSQIPLAANQAFFFAASAVFQVQSYYATSTHEGIA